MNDNIRTDLFVYANFILRGRLFAYLLGLVLTPIIMRFFSPEAYGSVAITVMAGAILASASTLALEKASLVSKDTYESDSLRQLSAVSTLTFVAIATILLLVQYLFFEGHFLQSNNIFHFLLATLLEAGACIAIAERVSHNQIQRVASADVLQMLVTSFGRIFSGYQGYTGALTLFVWYAIGMIFKLMFLLNYHPKNNRGVASIIGKHNELLVLLKDYSDFPKYNVPTGLMSQLGTYLPLITFGASFGPVIAGYYAVARRFVKAPGNILTSTIRPILIKQFSSRLHDQRTFNGYFFRASALFFIFGIGSLVVFLIFTNFFLRNLLQSDWANIIMLLNLLSPLVVVPFITLPVGAAVVAHRCQKANFRIQSIITVVRNLSLLGASIVGFTWERSALTFSIVSVICSLFGSYYVYRAYIFKKA